MLDCLLVDNFAGARIGRTLTFLSDAAMVELEGIADTDRSWAATTIQSVWKMHQQRVAFRAQRR